MKAQPRENRTSPALIKVIAVEPKYQINLGYMARALMNFGISEFYLVNPRCNYRGAEARKYSKHAWPLLEGASVCGSVKSAIAGCDIVVGTTGIWHKSKESLFNIYTVERVARLAAGRKVALLIGRDDTGLSKAELKMCDASVFIPASREYPILNVSHALAVLLYEFKRHEGDAERRMSRLYAGAGEIAGLIRLFASAVEVNPRIRNKRTVTAAFAHVLHRAAPTHKEINAIAIAIAPARLVKSGKSKRANK